MVGEAAAALTLPLLLLQALPPPPTLPVAAATSACAYGRPITPYMAGERGGGGGALACVLGVSLEGGAEPGDWKPSDEAADAPRWGRSGDTQRPADSLARVQLPTAACADDSVSGVDSRSGDDVMSTMFACGGGRGRAVVSPRRGSPCWELRCCAAAVPDGTPLVCACACAGVAPSAEVGSRPWRELLTAGDTFSGCLRGRRMGEAAALPPGLDNRRPAPLAAAATCCGWEDHSSWGRCAKKCGRPLPGVTGEVSLPACTAPDLPGQNNGVSCDVTPPR
jgi:hypothetical protein